jgi:hypothetical protein
MTTLPPEPRPTVEAGQRYPQPTYDSLEKVVREAAAEVARDLPPTSFRDESDVPETGDAPPHQQPGRPAMSQKGMDDSVRMLCFGGSTFVVCGGVAIVMIASDHADPTAIGSFFGGLAFLALAIRALVTRAKRLVPDEHHHHYNAPVEQDFSSHESKHFSLTAKHDHTINPEPRRKGRR